MNGTFKFTLAPLFKQKKWKGIWKYISSFLVCFNVKLFIHREIIALSIPEQIYEWYDNSNLVKLWRVDIPSYEFHVSFIRHSTTNSISGLSGTLTLHRGMLYLFLVPNDENLLGYYFKHANSWQMTSISLQNQTIVPIECESLATMCSRDRYIQMALINNWIIQTTFL